MRISIILAISILSLLAAGCGGGQDSGAAPAGNGVPPTSSDDYTPAVRLDFPPQLERPALGRSVSSGTTTIEGLDYSLASGGDSYDDTDDGSHVLIPGGEDELAFAIYAITGFDTARPVQSDFTVSSAPLFPGGEEELPLSYWVGMSDYTHYGWSWQGPYTEPMSLAMNNETVRARYIDETGTCFMAIATRPDPALATPENPEGITAVRIAATVLTHLDADDEDYEPTLPPMPLVDGQVGGSGVPGHFTSDADKKRETSAVDDVVLGWFHTTDEANPACEADYYDIYRTRIDTGERRYIGRTDAPVSMFTDPADALPGVPELLDGYRYNYSVRAGNETGTSGYYHFHAVLPVYQPPSQSAARDPEMQQVLVSWEPAVGATSYNIYRGDNSSPVASVEDTFWYDAEQNLLEPQEYWVQSVSPVGVVSELAESVNYTPGPLVADFVLTPFEITYANTGSAVFDFELLPGGENNELGPYDFGIRITGNGASTLRGYAFRLQYPGALFSCLGMDYDTLNELGTEAVPLTTGPHVFSPGVADFALCRPHPEDDPGLSGDLELCDLLFVLAPEQADALVRSVPHDPLAEADTFFEPANSELQWRYFSPGDTDQNGVVNAADLIPIAVHFSFQVDVFGGETAAIAAADCDRNMVVEEQDVMLLDNFYGRSVASWNVYASQDPEDYPSAGGASVIDPRFSVTFDQTSSDPAVARLLYEEIVDVPWTSAFLWVRPVYAGDEGKPSTMAVK